MDEDKINDDIEDNQETKKTKEINIKVDIDEQIAQGQYSNLAIMNFSKEEFVLDFLFLQPHVAKGRVRSRQILTPGNAKRLANMLMTNIQKYEENFGPIDGDDLQPPAPGIQFSIN
jgi:hypothetical protein